MLLPNQSANLIRDALPKATGLKNQDFFKIMPQRWVDEDVVILGCIPNCVCISQQGCPCCTSMVPSRSMESTTRNFFD